MLEEDINQYDDILTSVSSLKQIICMIHCRHNYIPKLRTLSIFYLILYKTHNKFTSTSAFLILSFLSRKQRAKNDFHNNMTSLSLGSSLVLQSIHL